MKLIEFFELVSVILTIEWQNKSVSNNLQQICNVQSRALIWDPPKIEYHVADNNLTVS